MSWTFLRSSNSLAIRPASIVFAETHVVGDEEVHAGQAQRFLERLELISVDANTGPER